MERGARLACGGRKVVRYRIRRVARPRRVRRRRIKAWRSWEVSVCRWEAVETVNETVVEDGRNVDRCGRVVSIDFGVIIFSYIIGSDGERAIVRLHGGELLDLQIDRADRNRISAGIKLPLIAVRHLSGGESKASDFFSLCAANPAMPSPRAKSRSPSPYTKRARRSYQRESRSPSPQPRHYHDRSRSPRRRHEDSRPKKSSGGFRWKEKPRQQDDDDNRGDERRLERGYREQEQRPRHNASPVRGDRGRRDDEIEAKFGRQRFPVRQADRRSNGVEDKFGGEEPKKEKKKKDKPAVAPTSQEMIIVNVNDRLGTKASIPCLASDPISTLYLPPPSSPTRLL